MLRLKRGEGVQFNGFRVTPGNVSRSSNWIKIGAGGHDTPPVTCHQELDHHHYHLHLPLEVLMDPFLLLLLMEPGNPSTPSVANLMAS